MKVTASIPAACGTSDCRRSRGVVRWAIVGFGLGVASAAAYLFLGGQYLWGIPRWASIVFYPGFLAGFKVNEWGLDKDAAKIVGVVTVGLAYAALAILARLMGFALKHHRRVADLKQNSE